MAGTVLYDRRASITIQPAEFTGNGKNRKLATPWSAVNPYPGLNNFSGLRMDFNIEKTIQPEPNRATIRVFNLNQENRVAVKRDDLITLRAGYVGDVVGEQGPQEIPIIFRGNVTHINQTKDPTDWVTEYRSGDGDALKKGFLNDILPPGTSPDEIVDRIKKKIKDMGVELMTEFDSSILYWITEQFRRATSDPSNPGATTADQVTQGTKALVGRLDDIVNGELDKVGLSWSVQDNVFIVRPKGGDDGQEAIVLSPSTGLIGSPEITEKGVAFKSLIIKGLSPGRLIRLESRVVTGEYVVTRANYSGDTHGPNWYITGEAMVSGSRIEVGS